MVSAHTRGRFLHMHRAQAPGEWGLWALWWWWVVGRGAAVPGEVCLSYLLLLIGIGIGIDISYPVIRLSSHSAPLSSICGSS